MKVERYFLDETGIPKEDQKFIQKEDQKFIQK